MLGEGFLGHMLRQLAVAVWAHNRALSGSQLNSFAHLCQALTSSRCYFVSIYPLDYKVDGRAHARLISVARAGASIHDA